MLVFFNRLLGMEKWCFSSSIRPERVYWNIIIKTLMQGLYLVAMLWIMLKRHLYFFPVYFLGWEKGEQSHAFSSMAPPLQMVEGSSKQSLARHRAWLSSPHADLEQGLGKVVLTFSWCWSPVVSASALKGENCWSPIVLWQLYGQFGEYWLFVLRDTIKCPEFPPYWMEHEESLTVVFSSPRVGEL